MKRALTISAMALSIWAGASIAQVPTDKEAIHQVLEDYIVGWRDGNAELLSRAFATESGTIMWVGSQDDQQVLQSMTFEAAIARGKSNSSYGLEWQVLSLDVVDSSVALAKLDISRSRGSYIDFLTLYKIDGSWKIVNKVFASRAD
jgi:hypothetical protein